MLWAQVFPFVALQLYDGEKEAITTFLIATFSVWLLLNIAFFNTIDHRYLTTFFGTTTAPQYTCELFLTSEADSAKFRAAFKNRISYTTTVQREVKIWVAANINSWKTEKPDWFKIEKIPDEFLPSEVLIAEGGARRRRSSYGLREIVGLESIDPTNNEQQIISLPSSSVMVWETLAEDIYKTRTSNHKVNYAQLKRTLDNNEVLFALIISRCKPFRAILSYILAAGQIKLFDEVEGE